MKTEIFSRAIHFRNMIRFIYFLEEIMLEPYFISSEKSGRKVLYGRVPSTNQVRKFEYKSIANIRVLKEKKFSPVIPIKTVA